MENHSENEATCDAKKSISRSVKFFEKCWFPNRAKSVYRHTNDDVDRARHEGVDERYLDVGLIEDERIRSTRAARRDVGQGGHRGQQHAQVGDSQPAQVHVHHPLHVLQYNQTEEVADQTDDNNR